MEFNLQSDSNCHSVQQPEQYQISVHFLSLSPNIFFIFFLSIFLLGNGWISHTWKQFV